MSKMRILVAPLNWGLGHATRCIPIIKELERNDFEPILASDGVALSLLKKEFPHLRCLELPAYMVTYAKKGYLLKWIIVFDSPRIHKVIASEKLRTEEIVKEYNIGAIISDNRFGVYSDQLKRNVFITHQIKVLSGSTTFISSYFNRKHLQNFDQCWIPDFPGTKNLSGKLSHPKKLPENCEYIGPLSRFEKVEIETKYDYLLLLSGPEPQREMLEKILLKKFKNTTKRVLMVRGVVDDLKMDNEHRNIQIKNYLFGKELEEAINSSEIVVSRSGYTTLMDLSKLEKKAFLIPTPGQEEQIYLAKRLEKAKIAPYCKQEDFDLDLLENVNEYTGLRNFGKSLPLRNLFSFFHGE